MATKIKGIYKGFKFISQIFVVKEREMEIGYPTDVKHVAHIGWEGPSGNAPSWMNEFKTPPDFSTTTLSANPRDHNHSNSITLSPWSSQDFEQSTGHQALSNVFSDSTLPFDPPNVPKKARKKKKTSTSSPKSSSNSSRSTRSTTRSTTRSSKTSYHDLDSTSTLRI